MRSRIAVCAGHRAYGYWLCAWLRLKPFVLRMMPLGGATAQQRGAEEGTQPENAPRSALGRAGPPPTATVSALRPSEDPTATHGSLDLIRSNRRRAAGLLSRSIYGCRLDCLSYSTGTKFSINTRIAPSKSSTRTSLKSRS
eukprot:SAG31_NODE_1377_length_8589_cov_2.896584_4_plen_141_part_00